MNVISKAGLRHGASAVLTLTIVAATGYNTAIARVQDTVRQAGNPHEALDGLDCRRLAFTPCQEAPATSSADGERWS